MKRTIVINGRPKGNTFVMCEDHTLVIDAETDMEAWGKIHEGYEHVTRAHFEGTLIKVHREGTVPWAQVPGVEEVINV